MWINLYIEHNNINYQIILADRREYNNNNGKAENCNKKAVLLARSIVK